MNSEVRPPYISRTISSRPRRPSAPRKNLPPASNQTGPIGLPSRLTTSRFSPSTVSFSSVWVVFGPVWATLFAQSGAARHEDDDQDEERQEGKRHTVATQPPVGQVPGACVLGRTPAAGESPAPRRKGVRGAWHAMHLAYLNWKLVRSCPKVGLKITLSRSIALETKVETVRFP